MATKKISELTALASGSLASTADVLAIVDTSANTTNKITIDEMMGSLNLLYAVNVLPSLNGLTAATADTGGTTTGVNGQLHVKNFTGAAAEVVTLPAATVGARCAFVLSTDTTGGTNKLTFDCAGSDAYTTGTIIESRNSNIVVYDTSTAGETKIEFTPVDSANNYISQGSIFYFWCTVAGLWNVQLNAKSNPAGTGLVGATVFAA